MNAGVTQTVNKEKTESKKINEWFDKVFDEAVNRSPVWQSYLGIKKDYDKWDDISEQRAISDFLITKKNFDYLLKNFDAKKLDAQTKVSYDLFFFNCARDIKSFLFRHYNYPVNQMFGTHSWIPSFLIDIHQINDEQDALAYISRVTRVDTLLNQLIDNLKIRENKNIIVPKFIIPKVIDDCNNIIKGKPFTNSQETSPVLEDFTAKVKALNNISESRKSELISQLETALKNNFKPAYERLISYLKELETKATNDEGVWKFPDGEKYYNLELETMTTTKMTADEIYETGTKEIARIHDEMRAIMKKVNYKSDNLNEFFKFIENDSRFYYPQTEEGKKQCLSDNQKIIDDMKKQLPKLFNVLPKAQLLVKPVEPYREKTAGEAFYQDPAPDGSRPGIYYVNLYDMKQMPKYQLEALAYHEAIPGHHMQLSIQQELIGLPKFRTLGSSYTAYVEGWGLYAELVPKEIGFYKDPYQDFGRLTMELWRACRLVADVGIHRNKWTREEAIKFYEGNTPASREECVKMVERHMVMPAQATAYKVGQMKILELRELAKQKLGNKFDIKEFHDVILKNGSLPLDILENLVNEWAESKMK
jgi:uncharacterized protein (DUF885 family)